MSALEARVSMTDLARLADVSIAAVSNWRRRHSDFPSPHRVSGQELFRIVDVADWLGHRKIARNDLRDGEQPGVTYGVRFLRNLGMTGEVRPVPEARVQPQSVVVWSAPLWRELVAAAIPMPSGRAVWELLDRATPHGDRLVAGPGTIGRSEDRASSGVPIVAPRNIRHHRIAADDLMFTTTEAAAKLSRYRVVMGDVVCTRTGELERNALVAEGQAGWLLGTGCMRLRSTGGVIATYLTYCLANPAVRDWIQRNAPALRSVVSVLGLSVGCRSFFRRCPCSAGSEKFSMRWMTRSQSIDQISTATAALRDSLLPLLMTGYGSFVDF